MARTAITITDTSLTGATQPAQQNADDVNGMHLAYNDGKIVLELAASVGTVNFTILTPGNVAGLAVTDLAVAVTNPAVKYVGPFPKGAFDQSDGTVHVDIDSADGRIRAIRLK